MSLRWLKETTQSYRMGFVEGRSGERNHLLLESGATDIEEYNRGFADGSAEREEAEKEAPDAGR